MADKRLSPNREKRIKGTVENENERIRRDFSQLKKNGWSGAKLRMHLAQKYKRPIREINEITEQADKLKAKADAKQEREAEAERERKRIEALGQHGFQPEEVVSRSGMILLGTFCVKCREPEMSKRHELHQARLV